MTVLVSTEALSQAYYCDRPREPDIPSPYSVEYEEMKRTEGEVEEYIDEMNEYSDCLRMEHDDARSELSDVIDEWDDVVRRFNAR